MQLPPVGTATETLLDVYGEAHLVALETEEETTDLAPDFDTRQNSLRSAFDARKAAERLLVRRDTLVYKTEVKVENVIRQVEGRALLRVAKNAGAEPYVTAFPGRLKKALAPVGEAQAEEGRRIAGCYPVESASADLAEFVPTLLTLCDTLQTRCREADAAEKTLAQAMALELTERRQWYAQYRKDEGLLIAVYPTTKPFVDTFFKSPRKTKKKKPVTGGTGGEGTGGGE